MVGWRTWQGLIVTLIVVAGAFSGCLGDQAAPAGGSAGTTSDEPASTQYVTPAPGVVVAINRGAILGRVFDDANLSVPGARVALLETELEQISDASGEFRFDNVTPGEYTLRAEASAFQASETPVSVTRGNVSRVGIRLVPAEDAGAGYRPHPHDLWGADRERILVEGDFEFAGAITPAYSEPTVDRVLGAVYYSNANSTNAFYRIRVPDGAEPPRIVMPATKEIRITVTWTNPAGSTLEKMGVGVKPANKNEIQILPKQASGVPFVFPVAPEMVDSGHQWFTLWGFFLIPQNDVRNAPADKPAVSPGVFHVKILLVKGDEVPVDPSHEDHWGPNASIVVRPRFPGYSNVAANNRVKFNIPGGQLVPPGTATLRFTLWWSYQDAANGSMADRKYSAMWKSAERSPQTPELQYDFSAPTQDGDHKRVWELKLKSSQTDAFYQATSNWNWYITAEGTERDRLMVDPRVRNIELEVVAIKDPAFV